jgi:hypothetical protein
VWLAVGFNLLNLFVTGRGKPSLKSPELEVFEKIKNLDKIF